MVKAVATLFVSCAASEESYFCFGPRIFCGVDAEDVSCYEAKFHLMVLR